MKKFITATFFILLLNSATSYALDQVCQPNNGRALSGIIYNQNPQAIRLMPSDQSLNFKPERSAVNSNSSTGFILGKPNEVLSPGVITVSNNSSSCIFNVSYTPAGEICLAGNLGNNIRCIAQALGEEVVLTIK